jgi:acyl transferase domain-containing protein/SAM-dependent methyltransferase
VKVPVPASDLSATKRALVEIRELRARLAELEGAAREPIAIVGLAIRAPGGVHDAASFAEVLWNGRDAISPIPAERWSLAEWYDENPDTPAKMITRYGGFIGDVDRFDAEFFGISPREAASMDPQQRLLLELSWHALEDAGCAPASLAGSATGVYFGIANGDYGRALFAHPELIDAYFSPGNAYSVASGRIAYLLGLHGPAISIDTACSASLVALHLACQGLRHGDCERALVGGVNLILTPELNINFSKAGMMAPDGRCKAFDASADGYVRGEGGAVVVLRRLRDALTDGDRILAVVRGSAINQDGRSNGLTAPNGPAQEAVLRDALSAAGVTPAQVSYVETHGTGTSLGDPIEVNALGAVFGEGHDASRPLAIGSVKTNVGHLEAAAGIVSVVKTVLALERREIPPHLHFRIPNPYIDWASLPVTVPTRTTAWAPIEGRRIAGVSSFGFSGTNAHVVLEEAPAPAVEDVARDRPRMLLALSARDDGAMAERIADQRKQLAEDVPQPALADMCFTVNAGRSHFARRVAVHGTSAAELDTALAAWQRGETHPALTAGTVGAEAPRVAFLFPGQGPQYVNMGRALYDGAPVFRASFDACCDALDPLLPRPLRTVIFAPEGSVTPLDETAYAQPAMFAMEIALAALWRSWGIEPVAVMGHSFGEYAAACVAGAITVSDAARMVAARGRLAQTLPRDGGMTVIEAGEPDVAAAISRNGGRVSIAAVNGATNTVISGEQSAVDAIASAFVATGARVKALRVSHAFHSPLIEPVLDRFEREIENVKFAEPRVALISNLSGRLADGSLIIHSSYWRRHMREPVRFADSIRALAALDITCYIEMSPHPVLLGMGSESVTGGLWLPSLREGRDDWTVMFESLQALYCSGASVSWDGLDRGLRRRRVALRGYPFQRKRHWIDLAPPAPSVSSAERWTRLADTLDRQSHRAPLGLDVDSYPAKYACLARLTTGYAVATLRKAGLFVKTGERHTVESVLSRAGISATYRHLLRRWLEGLVARGLLERDGDAFRAAQPLPDPDLAGLWAEAEVALDDNRPLLDYVRHSATLVSDVLGGRESPLETLFPGGSFDLAESLYERSAMMVYINQLAAGAFELVSALTPTGRRLRILEVGAGTGGTTSALLRVLPNERCLYRFTDVSEVFLDRARQRFGGRPGVEFGLFDLDAEFEPQGYAPASFDVIVAANAVHAVKDVRAALSRLRELLTPGGLLILIESTVHLDYFDMTTGLIEGWQHFADDLRGDNPLLSPQSWIDAMKNAGFSQASAWPESGSPAGALGQHVIVAQAPGEAVADLAPTREPKGTTSSTSRASSASSRGAWLTELEGRLRSERLDLLRELVRGQVMQALRLDAASPPAYHDRLMNLGMDSLMAVQLRNGLNQALALERPLSSTVMFDHPTIDAIAAHLDERLAPSSSPVTAPVFAAAPSGLDADAVAVLCDSDIERMLDERLGAK